MIHHNCPQCYTEHKFELKTQSKHICTNCNKEMLSSFNKQNVFLTYSNDHNKQVVEKIKRDMEARGHLVFIDKEIACDTPTWKENLQSELKEKSVVSFLSEQAVSNPGDCLDQIAVALGAKGGHIQTILLEDETKVSPPPSVSHVQWLNMVDWQDKLDTDSLWYGNKMLELLNVIESSENINFAGEIEKLNEYLRPITSSQRINQLISSPFIGRQWVFDAIEQWRTADDNKRIFWLSGLPGVGKSAVSAQLAHYCKDKVAAVHFCDYSNTEHRNASRVIRSICFQLCTRIPEFRTKVLFIPEVFDHSIDKMDSSELFECIIIKPLSLLIDSGRDRSLIVIDALDEATENKRNQLVDILAKYADRIPQWIRFVVTGRPEKELTGSLKDMEYDLLDISSKQNKADLEEYIRLKLPEQLAQCTNEQEAITNLIEKSEGIFLYIVQVCEEILQGHFSLTEPDKFPIGLDGLYYAFFLRLTNQVDKPEEEVDTKVYHEKYHTQLSMIMAAIEDLPTAIIKESCSWSAEQLNRFLLQIRTLFPTGTGADGETIHPFHKTIVDWISNAERAKQFVVNIELGHQTIINNVEPKFFNKEILEFYTQLNLPVHYLRIKKWEMIIELNNNNWNWAMSSFKPDDLNQLISLHNCFKTLKDKSSIIDISNKLMSNYLTFKCYNLVSPYVESIINTLISITQDDTNEEYLNAIAVDSYMNYGIYLNLCNKPNSAVKAIWQAFTLHDKSKCNTIECIKTKTHILNTLGLIHQRLGNSEKAIKYLQECYETLNKYDIQDRTRDLLINLSNIYFTVNNLNIALTYAKKALIVTEKSNFSQQYQKLKKNADVNDLLGLIYFYLFDSNNSKKHHQIAIEYRRQLVSIVPYIYNADLAESLNNLGNVESKAGNYNQALDLYYESADISNQLGQINPDVYLEGFADTLGNITEIYIEKKNYEEAYENCLKVITIYKMFLDNNTNRYLLKIFSIQLKIARIYSKQDEFSNAIKQYNKALIVFNDDLIEVDYLLFCSALKELADIHIRQNELDLAVKYLEKVEDILLGKLNVDSNAPYLAYVTAKIGEIYLERNNLLKAKDKLLLSAKCYKIISKNQTKESLDNFAQSLDRIAELIITINVVTRAEHDSENTEIKITSALMLAEYLVSQNMKKYFYSLVNSLINYGSFLKKQSRYKDATFNYQKAIKYLFNYNSTSNIYNPLIISKFVLIDLCWLHLLQDQFKEAINVANKYFELNNGVDIQVTKVAHALLFLGKYKEAESIYIKNKGIKISEDGKTFDDVILEEFDELEQHGITNPDVAKIRKLLNHHTDSKIEKALQNSLSDNLAVKLKFGLSIIENINSCRNEGVQSKYKLSDVEKIISSVNNSDDDIVLKLILRFNLLKAEIAMDTEEYEKALDFCEQGELAVCKMKEQDQVSEYVGSLYSSYGDIYFKVQIDLPKALEYYSKSEKVFIELLSDNYEIIAPKLAAIQTDMAKIYQKQNISLEALDRLENILEIRIELSRIHNELLYHIGIGNALEAIATFSQSMKNYKRAAEYYQKAITTFDECIYESDDEMIQDKRNKCQQALSNIEEMNNKKSWFSKLFN